MSAADSGSTPRAPAPRPTERVLRGQAAYYAVTAIWPLVHMASFEAVTGRKTDRWLVRTIGLLIGATAVSLMAGARAARPETLALATASAASLAAVDVVYVAKGVIRPVYLLDAAAEVGIVAALARAQASEPEG